jgi:hypothetical protein
MWSLEEKNRLGYVNTHPQHRGKKSAVTTEGHAWPKNIKTQDFQGITG